MELKYIATREGRLSSFLKGELKMSTGLMNKLKWGDAIRVNGKPEHTDYPVKIGDTVTVRLDEPAADYPAQEGPLTVLYEDQHLLAVDKPAGMLIHPPGPGIPIHWPISSWVTTAAPGRIPPFIP